MLSARHSPRQCSSSPEVVCPNEQSQQSANCDANLANAIIAVSRAELERKGGTSGPTPAPHKGRVVAIGNVICNKHMHVSMCGRVVAELSGIRVFEATPVAHECHPAGLYLIQTCSKMVRGADINVFIFFLFFAKFSKTCALTGKTQVR